MTIISNLKRYAIVAALVLGVTSCSEDDTDNPVGPNIVETAIAEEDLSILVEALQITGLDETLSGSGPFTVLAPTDETFRVALTDLNVDSISQVPVEILRPLLLNHVILDKELTSETLIEAGSGYDNTAAVYDDGDDTTTDPALSIFFNTVENKVTFNGINVLEADIEASNGIIHKISGVLNLPRVATIAVADSDNFSSLLAAVAKVDSDLQSGLATALFNVDSELTLFAPTNEAFSNALTALGFNSLDDVPSETLLAILQAHIIGDTIVRAEDLVDGDVTTLNGDITINAGDTTVLGPGNSEPANITTANLTGINGVIHIIDSVILPEL
ncbi:fasciclin domain-containing protein [Aquimarina sp. ERC-38]|uniref:fasciclin domain-containing protein n=1 Tax=Aquimarina sp. ERC-38 TaxID=2949996 RepID=UPI0022459929|nr:fasciclin domain-containing protein [Aquimarina sp. ERC-38]UZO80475.1 fasciclin domain-containing protein [Aquimarina sp. ERC-38]